MNPAVRPADLAGMEEDRRALEEGTFTLDLELFACRYLVRELAAATRPDRLEEFTVPQVIRYFSLLFRGLETIAVVVQAKRETEGLRPKRENRKGRKGIKGFSFFAPRSRGLRNELCPPTQNVTPILVMSMHHDAEQIRASLNAGANGYILKGEFLEELSQALMAVYQGGRYLSKQATVALAQGEQ